MVGRICFWRSPSKCLNKKIKIKFNINGINMYANTISFFLKNFKYFAQSNVYAREKNLECEVLLQVSFDISLLTPTFTRPKMKCFWKLKIFCKLGVCLLFFIQGETQQYFQGQNYWHHELLIMHCCICYLQHLLLEKKLLIFLVHIPCKCKHCKNYVFYSDWNTQTHVIRQSHT